MAQHLKPRSSYSHAERVSDAVVHAAGLVAVGVAVPALLALAVGLGTRGWLLFGVTVYGATLAAMILFSALYNTVGQRRWRGLLRRLDHSAIYAKIAATYMPFTLGPGGHGGYLLAGLWTAALAGIGLKVASPRRLRWVALALYLGMGWAGIIFGAGVFGALSAPVLALIVTGGALYTLGVVFFLCERLPFHYTIWHALVLAASLVFYAAVTVHVVQVAPA
jgi:hemolysin III